MTRLLLCTATILALTASANAQFIIFGGGNSPSTHAAGVTRGNYPSAPGDHGCWSASKTDCYAAPKQAQPQRTKRPRR
jgi:hypothetical protein